MKFAVSYSPPYHGTDPDRLVAFARHAEECGFEGLYLPEHIVLWPGASIGPMELPPTLPYLDPLECLSFVAAATDRLLLGTGVLLAPYRHPVLLAKQLATIDVLSKGRLRLLTLGVGGLAGEAAAVGVDYASRGRRADEVIDLMRLLWAGDAEGVSFHGEFFHVDNLVSYPKPHRVTELPIHVGGSSRPAARRAGRLGAGYFAGGMLTPDERQAQLALAHEAAAAAGHDPATFEYTRWASTELTAEKVAALAAQGVTRLVINIGATETAAQRVEMSAFADRFLG